MKSTKWMLLVAAHLAAMSPLTSSGHDGRRFAIELAGDKLVAQGINSGDDDGAPVVRPYQSAIHDHWRNSPLGLDSALAILPEFDIRPPVAGPLVGYPLYLTLESAVQWDAPPLMPPSGTVPKFTPLPAGEVISVTVGSQSTTSLDSGTVVLTPEVTSSGEVDIGVLYEVNAPPEERIHVLTFGLSSGNPAVVDSDPIHILLSPDGATPMEKLHHASLFLEEYVATHPVAVPEPASLIPLGVGTCCLWYARRRRGQRVG